MSILVVDDQPVERALIADILSEHGRYRVETVSDGAAALERIRRGGIELVVTDYFMPGLDGVALAQLAIEADPSLAGRILLITGAMLGREDVLAFAARTEVLGKPFAPAQLLDKVAIMLARSAGADR